MSDLYIIDVFGVINSVLDNIKDNIQPLGEMSDFTKTFSSAKTRYANTALSTETHLNVMRVRRDGVDSTIPAGALDRILTVHRKMVTRFNPSDSFTDQMRVYYPELSSTLEYQDLVSFGGWLLPGYVTWEETIAGNRVRVNLWLSDAVMRATYTNYEIRVIPPVRDLADMQSNVAVLQHALDQYTRKMLFEDIRAANGGNEDPEMDIVTLDLRWVEQATGATLETSWTLLLYGPNALDRGNQIEAVRNYLRDATGVIPPEWVELIPEIDTTTTMVIFPLWDKIAVHRSGSIGHVMSPVLAGNDIHDTLSRRGRPITDFVRERTEYSVSPYKSIGFVVHPEEISAAPRLFSTLYPQYAAVQSNTPEIMMLDPVSREGVRKIEMALRIADDVEMSAEGTLADGYALEAEDSLAFLIFRVNDVVHRLATRKSYFGLDPYFDQVPEIID